VYSRETVSDPLECRLLEEYERGTKHLIPKGTPFTDTWKSSNPGGWVAWAAKVTREKFDPVKKAERAKISSGNFSKAVPPAKRAVHGRTPLKSSTSTKSF
jgi:hypothetical protein